MSPAKTVHTSSTAPTSPVQGGAAAQGKKGAESPVKGHSSGAATLFADTSRHEVPKFPTPAMVSPTVC